MPSFTPGVIGQPRREPQQPVGQPGSAQIGAPTNTQTSNTGGGGTYMNYDPRIGQGPLPPNTWGAANRAYVREPRTEEMSSYQLERMSNPNTSALARNAMARAAQQSAARGGLNSTMAQEAAQKAIIETGAPFALQQAGAYGQAASENQQYLNQRDIANMEMENSMRQYGAQLEAAQLGNEYELMRQRERLAFEGEQSELGRQYGFNMAGMENQFGQEADYRRYQIQGGLNQQMFNFEQMSELYNYGNQARQDAFRSILELTMNSPEEMDEFISSGMMEFFNNFANQYFTPAFNNIYGGGP